MSSTRSRTAIVAVILVALVLTLALAACGSDKGDHTQASGSPDTTSPAPNGDMYSGAWTGQTPDGGLLSIKIEKRGGKWVVTDLTESPGAKLKGSEENGKLTIKDPDYPSQTMTFERQDDTLVWSVTDASAGPGDVSVPIVLTRQ